ncbi:unnamed protein product [Clonostachys solani]|uniref:Major facilitator superfamily (MFS) profile domain-containing protein n=1 Tax=Clonostachys solani TaxID=160281 RepID=A0A9P0ERY1_9HYPO|nr:unnamed protein product [Clonostachys solani]
MGRQAALAKAELTLHDQVEHLPKQKLIAVFGLLALTVLINFTDQNGISMALPTIAAELDARDTISWAGTASLLANTTFQMLWGRLSDIFGRKTVYISAIALLSIADLLCGLSRNATSFYIFRGLAGVGGGGITNLAMIVVSDVVTLENRGKYQGIIGSMVGLGSIIGPFLAAAFAERATWRGYFWLLSPCAALAAVLTYFYLPTKPRTASWQESVKKVDWWGSFAIFVGIVFLLIPISGGGAYFEWKSSMVICLLVLGGISLILFVVIEWRVAKLPMMPGTYSPRVKLPRSNHVSVDIYKNPAVTAMLVQNFLMGASYQAWIYFVPLYLQNAHQFSIIQSALIWIPLVGFQSGISILSGLYISKFKRYGEILWFGFGIWTLGSGLSLLLTRESPVGIIIIPLIVVGIGVGCIFQPILVALQAHSPKARRAVIISNRNFCRCAGGACGLAVSAAVMQASLRASLPAEYANLAGSTFTLPEFDGDIPAAVLDAYMAASRSVFILQVPLIGLCFLGNFFIRDRGLELPDEKSPVQEQEPEQAGGEQGIMIELAESDANIEAGVKGTSRSK